MSIEDIAKEVGIDKEELKVLIYLWKIFKET
jgi:hypothetical protein